MSEFPNGQTDRTSTGSWVEVDEYGAGGVWHIDCHDISPEDADKIAAWIESPSTKVPPDLVEIIRSYLPEASTVETISFRAGWGVRDDAESPWEVYDTEAEALADLGSK